ncbi:MAG TPA: GNAT family N-acetyltransferase, partial [Paludibacteraceae bacterium]|nr:GNAT family N-acetyltransferase [Paludibacteraceae bacterium]
DKIREGKAIIALSGDEFAGFCYIESWSNKQYVANSGLIVPEKFRGHGLAKKIKKFSFDLSRKKFPDAKLFGLTSGAAVMKINTELGYVPVTFSDLTDDDAFWKGCEGCVNFDVLKRTNRRYCICTAMLYDPHKHDNDQKTEAAAEGEDKGFFASLVDLIKKSMNKKGK